MNYDVLYNFISPVTGKLPIQEDYILLGDYNNLSIPSPILIDLRLDLVNLRNHYNILNKANFVIGFPNSELPDAQVLNTMPNGYMYNTAGIVSCITNIPYAPNDATFILQTPNTALPNAQGLNGLGGGLLKTTILSNGAISIASGGGTPFINDYVDPFTLQTQIAETKAFATAEAAAAEAAAISTSISYFTAQMAPYVPSVIPFTGIGFQITGAIGAAAALATAAQSSADNANTRIDNLSIAGDVIGTNMGSDIIVTVFTPNPTFAGKSHMKIPTGNIAERPLLPVQGMIRYNIEI